MREIMEQVVSLVGDENWDDLHCWSSSVDTGDSVLYLPGQGPSGGKIKIVCESKTLMNVQYDSALKPEYIKDWAGSLIHRNSAYTEASGEEFTLADIGRFGNSPQTASQARENPFWLALAGGDTALLSDYVNVVDSLHGRVGVMRFSVIASSPHAALVERLICFTGLNAKSNVSAKNLGSLNGAARFVGIPVDVESYFASASKQEGVAESAKLVERSGVNQDIKKVA